MNRLLAPGTQGVRDPLTIDHCVGGAWYSFPDCELTGGMHRAELGV